MSMPVIILNPSIARETGRRAQLSNIQVAKTVADVIRTCLGPRAMLKMLLDPMGGIVLTNDGNAILREIDVSHPAAKSMIELSRTQDEEVGDGTTSVIILAGEMLQVAQTFLERNIHPTVIIRGYTRALEDSLRYMETLAQKVNIDDEQELVQLVKSCLGTKMVSRWSDLMCSLALKAVRIVMMEETGRKDIDIKRYARIEKIPGGEIEDCHVLDGLMLNKDITHPKMRRRIENPRILLLDCSLEYKKGESQTNIELSKEEDFTRILKLEEEYIENLCTELIKLGPDVVMTEKGISDLAQHYFVKAGITAIRRVRKMDNNRIARATGATIVHEVDEAKPEDLGTQCGLFYVDKIGDEYYTYLVKCRDPKACTIVLRGASKDILNEIERNLHDAMNVTRNVFYDHRLLPGGGACEMAIAEYLRSRAKSIEGIEQWPYRAVADAFEVIPRTLIQNCGGNVIRIMTQLRAKHATGVISTVSSSLVQQLDQEQTSMDSTASFYGINGNTSEIVDMRQLGIYEPLLVKIQTVKTAIESACLLLRVDDIVSGISKKKRENGGGSSTVAEEGERDMPEAEGEGGAGHSHER